MTVVGVMMVKDEDDVVGGVVRHMSQEVDALIVADNASTDDTRKILDDLADRIPVTVIDDPDPAYRQSEKMTRLARAAFDEHRASWIVPFDADEIWYCRDGRLRDVLPTLAANVVKASLFNHFATAVDLDDPDPFRSMVWRQPKSAALPKVAFRFHPDAIIEMGNHGVKHPTPTVAETHTVELRHFPYRSAEQMVRKALNGAAAYKATNLPKTFGAHWRSYGDLIDRHGEEALHDVFREHFWYLSPVDSGLIHDPAPYLRWTS